MMHILPARFSLLKYYFLLYFIDIYCTIFLCLITPPLDGFLSACGTCHAVSAFFNILFHFFIAFICDGGTLSLCGRTAGQVDPLRLPPLFLYYILVLFSAGEI